MPDHQGNIRYIKPDFRLLREEGYYPVDMHLHTTHSDGLTRIPDLIRYASRHDIGFSITDHNEISGSLCAISNRSDRLIIPGTELETLEGPHLLFYFYTPEDMQEFFKDFSRERSKKRPGLMENLPVMECLDLAKPFSGLRIAAHPFGYFGINRGVLKCAEKQMLPGVLDNIDGIEVICGGMMKNLNQRAISYAEEHDVPFTGGSDAHILSDVGNVITAVQAETVEEFLDGIKKRKNLVIGKPGGYMSRGATAGVIAWSFVPYSLSMLGAHYSVQKRRTSHLVSLYRHKVAGFQKKKEKWP